MGSSAQRRRQGLRTFHIKDTCAWYHTISQTEKAVQDYLTLRERYRHAPPGYEREGISLRLAAIQCHLWNAQGYIRVRLGVPPEVLAPLQYLP